MLYFPFVHVLVKYIEWSVILDRQSQKSRIDGEHARFLAIILRKSGSRMHVIQSLFMQRVVNVWLHLGCPRLVCGRNSVFRKVQMATPLVVGLSITLHSPFKPDCSSHDSCKAHSCVLKMAVHSTSKRYFRFAEDCLVR